MCIKMELTQNQLRNIKEQVYNGTALDKLLSTQFPDASIAIIRGYDNFSYEAYTKEAFFNKEQAKKIEEKIKPNGTENLCDTYHIITGTVKDLNEGKISDLKTRQPLDNHDIKMIYDSLKENL